MRQENAVANMAPTYPGLTSYGHILFRSALVARRCKTMPSSTGTVARNRPKGGPVRANISLFLVKRNWIKLAAKAVRASAAITISMATRSSSTLMARTSAHRSVKIAK